jgi:hypothetical protein
MKQRRYTDEVGSPHLAISFLHLAILTLCSQSLTFSCSISGQDENVEALQLSITLLERLHKVTSGKCAWQEIQEQTEPEQPGNKKFCELYGAGDLCPFLNYSSRLMQLLRQGSSPGFVVIHR